MSFAADHGIEFVVVDPFAFSTELTQYTIDIFVFFSNPSPQFRLRPSLGSVQTYSL